MIKTIYVKLVLVFIGMFIIGNTVSFAITSFTAEKDFTDELSESLIGVLYTAKEANELSGVAVEDIEKLYDSGVISVKFFDDPNKLAETYGLSIESLKAIKDKPVILGVKHIDGKGRIPLSVLKSGEKFIVAAPKTDNALVLSLRNLILRVNLISILFGSIAMLIVARFLVKPIKALSHATERIARGDFDVYIAKRSNDEVGKLIDNFNIMTKELAGMEMMRNDFVSNISHEFKTPLTSIEGFTKLLRDCKNNEERNEYIDIITEETKRLSDLSGNILLLNRIENENIESVKELFRLDEQIRHVILLYENKWSIKDINLHLDLDEVTYKGNEQLLYQVWLNLFDNAVKFSKPGGVIEVNLRKTDGKTVFSITDYGKGVTYEEQNRMFEKFYTGDKSRNTEGNGLGLSIVKRIVDMHGGKIEVVSRLNEFTQVKVLL
ncbi:MAG: resE [Clostridiales bacterium]|nr:resE [Clostridiales bacterium]